MWQVSTAARSAGVCGPGRPSEQRCLPARWQEAGHEGGQQGWGHRGTGHPQAPCTMGRHKTAPKPVCVSPGALSPAQLATPPQSPPTLLTRCPKTSAAQKHGCRREKQARCPPVLSQCRLPGPQPRPRIRPRVTVVASPAGQAGTSPWGTPPPTAQAGPSGGLEMCDFPTAQPGLGPTATGSAQADRRDPGQETPDALWAQDRPPCPAPSWLHRAGRGTPSEQLCRDSAPQTHQAPTLKGRAGSSTRSLSRGLGHPGPCSLPTQHLPTPCREGTWAGPRGCPAPSQALPGQRVGEVAGEQQSLCSQVRGAPTALPARAPASSWRRMVGSRTSGPNWTRLRATQSRKQRLRAATPLSPARGSHSVAYSPGNCSSGGTIGRDHWFPWPPLPPGTASDPTFQLLCRAGGCQQLWNHPGTAAASPEEATFWQSSSVSPLRTLTARLTPVPATPSRPGRASTSALG